MYHYVKGQGWVLGEGFEIIGVETDDAGNRWRMELRTPKPDEHFFFTSSFRDSSQWVRHVHSCNFKRDGRLYGSYCEINPNRWQGRQTIALVPVK